MGRPYLESDHRLHEDQRSLPELLCRADGQKAGRRGGPKNILVMTELGAVVVPRGNVKFERRGKHANQEGQDHEIQTNSYDL